MARKPLLRSRKTELALGWVMFAGGALLLRDAYDQRGYDQPQWFRPFTFW